MALQQLATSRPRRGTVYVSILAVATLVSLLGISAVTAEMPRSETSVATARMLT